MLLLLFSIRQVGSGFCQLIAQNLAKLGRSRFGSSPFSTSLSGRGDNGEVASIRFGVDLPSFLWLWRVAAWAMGLAILAYVLLAASGTWLFQSRHARLARPNWLRWVHIGLGSSMVIMVILLLAIGVVGTLGHYGSLGHSSHLSAGLNATLLTLLSAWSASRISPDRPWARPLHLSVNLALLIGFISVSLTGWEVVQKYLP